MPYIEHYCHKDYTIYQYDRRFNNEYYASIPFSFRHAI